MPSPARYLGQALFFGACAIVVGYLSANPVYHQMRASEAQIKLAFRHGGVQVVDCKKPTAEELSKLPSNQRSTGQCSRERVPVSVEIELDGEVIYEALLEPTGLSKDMPSETYRKFTVSAGSHRIEARLRDSKRAQGFDYESIRDVELAPWQNLAIDFKAEQGGFLFR